MALNDPYTIHYNAKRDRYYVKRGNETFYDEDNNWILFETEEDAEIFIEEELEGILA